MLKLEDVGWTCLGGCQVILALSPEKRPLSETLKLSYLIAIEDRAWIDMQR